MRVSTVMGVPPVAGWYWIAGSSRIAGCMIVGMQRSWKVRRWKDGIQELTGAVYVGNEGMIHNHE